MVWPAPLIPAVRRCAEGAVLATQPHGRPSPTAAVGPAPVRRDWGVTSSPGVGVCGQFATITEMVGPNPVELLGYVALQ